MGRGVWILAGTIEDGWDRVMQRHGQWACPTRPIVVATVHSFYSDIVLSIRNDNKCVDNEMDDGVGPLSSWLE